MPKQSIICLILFLLIAILPSLCQAQDTITYSTPYTIPDYNSQIRIMYINGYSLLNGASFNDNIWFFGSNYTAVSMSAKNSNVTITHCSPFTHANPTENGLLGYFRYTVEGIGQQTFKIHNNWDIPITWHVYIDNTEKQQGDGWKCSNGWITIDNATTKVVVIAQLFPIRQQPQSNKEGTSFISPDMNSTIHFTPQFSFANRWLFNGTNKPTPTTQKQDTLYWQTIDNTPTLTHSSWWSFNNIQSQNIGAFLVKARNCRVTIDTLSNNSTTLSENKDHITTTRLDYWLNYSVNGAGQQSFGIYLPSNRTQPDLSFGYYCISIDGIVREKGDGWNYSEDTYGNQNWLTITNAQSNASIHTQNIMQGYVGGTLLDYGVLYLVAGVIVTACLVFFSFIIAYWHRKRRYNNNSLKEMQ